MAHIHLHIPGAAGELVLRTPRPEDLTAVLRIHADPRTNTHNPAGPMRDREQARALLAQWRSDWETHGLGYWAVQAQPGGRVIGFAGVRVIAAGEDELFNLYYRFAPEAWGRGIARLVAREGIRRAQRQAPARAVLARMQPGHVASERTALSAGLQPVGRDPWGRTVLADRPIAPAILGRLPQA